MLHREASNFNHDQPCMSSHVYLKQEATWWHSITAHGSGFLKLQIAIYIINIKCKSVLCLCEIPFVPWISLPWVRQSTSVVSLAQPMQNRLQVECHHLFSNRRSPGHSCAFCSSNILRVLWVLYMEKDKWPVLKTLPLSFPITFKL